MEEYLLEEYIFLFNANYPTGIITNNDEVNYKHIDDLNDFIIKYENLLNKYELKKGDKTIKRFFGNSPRHILQLKGALTYIKDEVKDSLNTFNHSFFDNKSIMISGVKRTNNLTQSASSKEPNYKGLLNRLRGGSLRSKKNKRSRRKTKRRKL